MVVKVLALQPKVHWLMRALILEPCGGALRMTRGCVALAAADGPWLPFVIFQLRFASLSLCFNII
jgi:hypothetical protein